MIVDYMRNERMACTDCGHDTAEMGERYMLDPVVWSAITSARYAHMLCIGCVERRMGGKLAPFDFIDCPLNRDTSHQSLRLRSRLRR